MTTTAPVAVRRNVALLTARVVAGILGAVQLTGATYFTVVAPEEAVWVGPWVDVPVIALLLTGVLLKLAVAVGPGLTPRRRVNAGLTAIAIGIAITLVKIPLYDEPEGVTFLAADGVLLALLLLARRGALR